MKMSLRLLMKEWLQEAVTCPRSRLGVDLHVFPRNEINHGAGSWLKWYSTCLASAEFKFQDSQKKKRKIVDHWKVFFWKSVHSLIMCDREILKHYLQVGTVPIKLVFSSYKKIFNIKLTGRVLLLHRKILCLVPGSNESAALPIMSYLFSFGLFGLLHQDTICWVAYIQ
jgi:hypothetical protein